MRIEIKKFVFLLFAIYTILPTYFRIGGINSQTLLAGIILLVYLLSVRKIRINRISLRYCLLFFIPYAIALILHMEWFALVRHFFELVILLIIISDYIRSNEDVLTVIKYIVNLSLFECVTAFIHFAIDFNVFSLLSNTTDINYTRSDYGAGTQYRFGLPRVEGSFSHAITFGIYLSVCAILCLFIYQKSKKKKYLVFYVMHFIAIFMTLSRMPILVFLFSQLIILMIMNVRKTIKVIFSIAVFLGISLLIVYLAFPEFSQRISTVTNLLVSVFDSENISGISTFNQNSAFSYRTEMFRNILPTLGENFLIGVGSNGMSDYSFLMNGTIQRSIDNQYLYFFVVYGVLGFLFTIFWFGQLLMFRIKKGSVSNKHDLTNFVLYRNLIVLIYGLNLFSVAMMEEYKIITVFIAISLSDVILNRKKYFVHSAYFRGLRNIVSKR